MGGMWVKNHYDNLRNNLEVAKNEWVFATSEQKHERVKYWEAKIKGFMNMYPELKV